jgi:dinuclear metal center YbgI/SA1388 family protein
MQLTELVEVMDSWLGTREVPDYPGAHNGLQVANSGSVTRVAAAVDASLPVIEAAVAAGADLLIVHHGLFWQGVQPIVGARYRKLKAALDGGLAIYSSHIPLDIHPQLGNNVQLARALGMTDAAPFFDFKGILLGQTAEVEGSCAELRDKLAEVVGGPVHLCPGGSAAAGRVGIITGGAGSEVEAIAACGINTFITGEGPHWSFPLAQECGINVLYAGHYATETSGVQALARELEAHFALTWEFLDHPTGL